MMENIRIARVVNVGPWTKGLQIFVFTFVLLKCKWFKISVNIDFSPCCSILSGSSLAAKDHHWNILLQLLLLTVCLQPQCERHFSPNNPSPTVRLCTHLKHLGSWKQQTAPFQNLDFVPFVQNQRQIFEFGKEDFSTHFPIKGQGCIFFSTKSLYNFVKLGQKLNIQLSFKCLLKTN